MSFQIDDEIDKAVDKMADQLKIRLKKTVVRSEKMVLKQYIASQKETVRVIKNTTTGSSTIARTGNNTRKKKQRKTVPPRREKDYGYKSDSSGYSSQSE